MTIQKKSQIPRFKHQPLPLNTTSIPMKNECPENIIENVQVCRQNCLENVPEYERFQTLHMSREIVPNHERLRTLSGYRGQIPDKFRNPFHRAINTLLPLPQNKP
jgi:hypothetical protein